MLTRDATNVAYLPISFTTISSQVVSFGPMNAGVRVHHRSAFPRIGHDAWLVQRRSGARSVRHGAGADDGERGLRCYAIGNPLHEAIVD